MVIKNMKNRVLAVLLTAVLLVGIIPVSVSGADCDIRFSLSSAYIDANNETVYTDDNGDYYEVEISLNLTRNDGCVAIRGNLHYSEAIELLYTSYGVISDFENFSSVEKEDLEENPYIIALIATQADSDVTELGNLINFTFRVPADSLDEVYHISFEPLEITDTYHNNITDCANTDAASVIEVTSHTGIFFGDTLIDSSESMIQYAPVIEKTIDSPRMYHFTGDFDAVPENEDSDGMYNVPGFSFTESSAKVIPANNPFVKIYYRTNIRYDAYNLSVPEFTVTGSAWTEADLVPTDYSAYPETEDDWGYIIAALTGEFADSEYLRTFSAVDSFANTNDENDFLDICYIGFFDSIDSALDAELEAPYTVHYRVNGKIVKSVYFWKDGGVLEHPDNLSVYVPGYRFAGWDTEDGIEVDSDLSIHAVFERLNVISGEELLSSNTNFSPEFTDSSIDYVRFSSSETVSNWNTRAFINVGATDIGETPYVKIYYKSNFYMSDSFGFNLTITKPDGSTSDCWTGVNHDMVTGTEGKWSFFTYALDSVTGNGVTWDILKESTIDNISRNFFCYERSDTGAVTGNIADPDENGIFYDFDGNPIDENNPFTMDIACVAFYATPEEAAEATLDVSSYNMVEFMLDGELYEEINFFTGDALVYPEEPAVDSGMVFAGWADKDGNIIKEGTPVNGKMTLYAVIAEYAQITYVIDEDTEEYADSYVGAKLEYIDAPLMLDGRYFMGWKLKEGTEITGDTTVYAIYSNTYRFTGKDIEGSNFNAVNTNGGIEYTNKGAQKITYAVVDFEDIDVSGSPYMKLYYREAFYADGAYPDILLNFSNSAGIPAKNAVVEQGERGNIKYIIIDMTQAKLTEIGSPIWDTKILPLNVKLTGFKTRAFHTDKFAQTPDSNTTYEFDIVSVGFFPTLKAAKEDTETTASYSVTYMSAGEVFAEQTYYTGEYLKYPENDPVAPTDYKFVGWDTDDGFEVTEDLVINAEYERYRLALYADDLSYTKTFTNETVSRVTATENTPGYIRISGSTIHGNASSNVQVYENHLLLKINEYITDTPYIKLYFKDNYLADGMDFAMNSGFKIGTYSNVDTWGQTFIERGTDTTSGLKYKICDYRGTTNSSTYGWDNLYDKPLSTISLKRMFNYGYVKSSAAAPYEFDLYAIVFYATLEDALNENFNTANEITVTFYNEDGSIYDEYVSYAKNIAISMPDTDPEVKNKTFLGWYSEPNGNGIKITSSTNIGSDNIRAYPYFVDSADLQIYASSISAGNTISLTAKLEGTTSFAGVLVATSYDANGCLVDVKSYTAAASVAVSLSGTNAVKVKLMWLKDIASMKPLCSPTTISIPEV